MTEETFDLGNGVTMTKTSVTAAPRKLKAQWTMEAHQDYYLIVRKPEWFFKAWGEVAKRMKWGAGGGWWIRGPWVDHTIEDELVKAMADEITQEIDQEILADLAKYQGS